MQLKSKSFLVSSPRFTFQELFCKIDVRNGTSFQSHSCDRHVAKKHSRCSEYRWMTHLKNIQHKVGSAPVKLYKFFCTEEENDTNTSDNNLRAGRERSLKGLFKSPIQIKETNRQTNKCIQEAICNI